MKKQGSRSFISFGDVSSSVSDESSSVAERNNKDGFTSSPVYTGSDPELSQACKRLVKKDNKTKLKAILEITQILASRGAAVVGDFLPYFVYILPRLALENSRQAREQLAVIFHGIIDVDKRLLGPYMKGLIGPWWTLSCDPCREVGTRLFCIECQRPFYQSIKPLIPLFSTYLT